MSYRTSSWKLIWDQAMMVARSQPIDWEDLRVWAAEEGAPLEELDRFERHANG